MVNNNDGFTDRSRDGPLSRTERETQDQRESSISNCDHVAAAMSSPPEVSAVCRVESVVFSFVRFGVSRLFKGEISQERLTSVAARRENSIKMAAVSWALAECLAHGLYLSLLLPLSRNMHVCCSCTSPPCHAGQELDFPLATPHASPAFDFFPRLVCRG